MAVSVQPGKPIRLGDWLLDNGHLTQTQLDLALREHKRKGGLLGEVMVELGLVQREVLATFLAHKTQGEQVDLAKAELAPEVVRLLSPEIARRLVAIPVSREGDVLNVAISDPLNVVAFDAIEQATGLRVNLVAAPENEIRQAIDRHHASGETIEQIVDELLKMGTDRLATATEKDAPMIRLVDGIIGRAINSGVSDIHIHPEDKLLRVRFRTDGVLQSGILLPKEVQPALSARFKILGSMDIGESRRPQGGRCTIPLGGREVGLRLSSLPTAFGESIVIRILDHNVGTLDLGKLGLSPSVGKGFREVLDRPHGVILVTGPTGSGKTTTLYTALSQIDSSQKSIFTLEDPVEFNLPMVRQTQVSDTVGMTFAEGLRTLLRQDPDVILVGETRDSETASLMVRAALTGHLVFSTLHTNDAIGAIPRLVDLGVEPYLLAPTLIGVIGQRLVRGLCPECRVPVPEAADILAGLKVELDPDLPRALWRAGGCEECKGKGYVGRLGIHEFFSMDAGLQSAIVEGVDVGRLTELARANGFRTLFEDGVAKAMKGLTSFEEILRVTQH